MEQTEHRYTHADPLDVDIAAYQARWPEAWRATLGTPEMHAFIDGMRLDGKTLRESVLDDLCTFFQCSAEEAVARARNWGDDGVAEWDAASGDITSYSRETVSSVYSLLWYAYLQAEGLYPSLAVGIARAIGKHGTSHLDFGSGVGTTGALFHSLGYRTALADVATNLLAFARFRLDRRGVEAEYVDLNMQQLPREAFDVITAIDVLAHVPDLEATAAALHGALRPGGLLFANLVTRQAAGDAPWHLYDDDRGPRRIIHRAGFEPMALIDKNAGIIYRRVERGAGERVVREVRDAVELGPVRGIYRDLRGRLRRG